MAFSIDKNSGQNPLSTDRHRGLGKFKGLGNEMPKELFFELEPAEVVDIILDDSHPDYESGLDIGKIKARKVISQNGSGKGLLQWLRPMDTNIKQLPLIGEYVIVAEYFGMSFWSRIVNIRNSVNNNSLPGFSIGGDVSGAAAEEYEEAEASGGNTGAQDGDVLGDAFVAPSSDDIGAGVHPLRLYEGDMTFEGRFGQSIRFGSFGTTPLGVENGFNPYDSQCIKIQCGQQLDTPVFEVEPISSFNYPVEENVNTDGSSLWMTNMEPVELVPATVDASTHFETMEEPPEVFDGKQIILNSDRLIFNSKLNDTLIFSKKEVYINTETNFVVDADANMWMNTGGQCWINAGPEIELKTRAAASKVVVTSPKIFLGSSSAKEHVVLGDTLKKLLEELIGGIQKLVWTNGAGPAKLIPGSDAGILSVKSKLQTMLSKQNTTL